MRVNLASLNTYSKCPALFSFERHFGKKVARNEHKEIIRQVIAKCYLRASETKHLANWREIISWIDGIIFKDADIGDKESYIKDKITAEHCLNFLRIWYNTVYLAELATGHIELELSMEISNTEVTSTVPLVAVTEDEISLVHITTQSYSEIQIASDIIYRGQALMLSNALKENNIKIVCMTMGSRGSFSKIDINTTLVDHNRARYNLEQIIESMKNNYSYPSITEDCNTCRFARRCKF